MRYLRAQEILVLHARIIDETGGLHGVRDVGLLASLCERPKSALGGREMYEGIFEKGATYVESLATYHVFVDGNKRTALAATARFLFLNGYAFSASNTGVEKFILGVSVKKTSLQQVAHWLKRHSILRKAP